MNPACVVACAALLLAVPVPARADDAPAPAPRKTFRDSLRTFGRDGRYLLTFPSRPTPRGIGWTAGWVAATALTLSQDQDIRDEILESPSATRSRIATKFEPLGRIEVEAAALGTFYLAARGARNESLTATAGTAFEAFLWSGIITSVTKAAFGREGPATGSGEGKFFADDTAFPSGHTARSFAIAAVFADRWGRKGALVAYPVAALIGLSTIEQDDHWASDVIAGAGLGLAIGKGIAARHPRGSAPAVAWSLAPSRGGVLARFVF